MNEITLRAPGTDLDAMPLSQGMLAVGRSTDGALCALGDPALARACFCLDRRGVWLVVTPGVRGVHVNGRPVQRKAMLRAGDAVHVDGVEITLVGEGRGDLAVAASAAPTGKDPRATDPRVVLRGTTGPHHGRSLTLDQPRLVGSAADADIRIEDADARVARLSMEGGQAVLRVLERGAVVRVNGQACESAVLRPGDQVAFDGHHRFVLEAPTPVLEIRMEGEALPELPVADVPVEPKRLRLPWLLLAAVLLAGALTALLLL